MGSYAHILLLHWSPFLYLRWDTTLHYEATDSGLYTFIIHQGRTQEGADGAKPLPLHEIPGKIIYSFKSGTFYVSQFVHPVADYVPPIQLINIDIIISPIADVHKFFLHNTRLLL